MPTANLSCFPIFLTISRSSGPSRVPIFVVILFANSSSDMNRSKPVFVITKPLGTGIFSLEYISPRLTDFSPTNGRSSGPISSNHSMALFSLSSNSSFFGRVRNTNNIRIRHNTKTMMITMMIVEFVSFFRSGGLISVNFSISILPISPFPFVSWTTDTLSS